MEQYATLASLNKQNETTEQKQARIRQIEPVERIEYDDQEAQSTIYEHLLRLNALNQQTGFTSAVVQSLWQRLSSVMSADFHRGPIPKSTSMDHLLLYLMWLKRGTELSTMARMWAMSESRLEDNLNRCHGALRTCLERTWWDRRRRPIFD